MRAAPHPALVTNCITIAFGVVWRKIKKGTNKVLRRDENTGKEVEDDIAEK